MIVSLLGLVISLFAYMLAFPHEHQKRFDVYFVLLALHVICAVGFWLMTFESAMDAFLYYRDPFGMARKDPFTDGTHFVVNFVQGIRTWLGGSFFDHFLFFQCFGMIGIALLMRVYGEVAESLGIRVPVEVYLLLFLPGLHFWTAGIGKDAPMLMAISIAIWSAVRFEKRFVWMALALVIMACVRPHIMPFVMAGLGGALLVSKRASPRLRIAFAPVAAIGFVIMLIRAAESLNIAEVSVTSMTNFVDRQQSFGEDYGSGSNLSNLPLPLKVFSLMFRPIWVDAQGMTQYVASLENTVLLGMCLYLLYHWKLLWQLGRQVYVVMYCLIFGSMLTVSLALVNYNIGLGQRMKMMAVPAILVLVGIVYMYKQYTKHGAVVVQPEPDQLPAETAAVRT
jgi:hypothetical protein